MKRFRLPLLSLALGGILVALTSCVAGVGRGADGSIRPVLKVGEPAHATVAAIDTAEAEGKIPKQSSDDVFGLIVNALGYVLLGGGTLGTAYAGVKSVAKRQVKAYDEEPFEGPNGERLSEADLVQTAVIADAVAADALAATDHLKEAVGPVPPQS